MIDFIDEALSEYAEVHDKLHQTGIDGTRFLKVQIDLADGEGLKWYCITAVEIAAP